MRVPMGKQRIKRATKRWLECAPAYVLACYDHPSFTDRYTVIFGGEMQEETHGQSWLHALGTDESGHCSGSFEFQAHELSSYRRANHKHLIRWRDLPLAVRLRARHWAEQDVPGTLTHAQITKIGAEESGIEERIAANA